MTAGVIYSPELPAVSVTSELNDTWFPTATFVVRQLDCLGGFGMRSPSNVIMPVSTLQVCTNNIPMALRRKRIVTFHARSESRQLFDMFRFVEFSQSHGG